MSSADVIVIGGGIQGASAAYNLAKLDCGKVLVLEREATGGRDGSTGRSASMFMHQTGSPALSSMAKRSYSIFQSLAQELETPLPFKQTGSILYGSDVFAPNGPEPRAPSASELRALLTEQVEIGIPTEWVDGEQLDELSNGLLEGTAASCGIYCPHDGYTDGAAVRDAYLTALRRLGGEVRFDSDVVGIDTDLGQVSGVVLADGEKIATPVVLNCAGIHAGIVGSWVGASLPLTVDQRFLAILARPTGVPAEFPIVEDHRHEWYFRPDPRGVLMGIGPTEKLDVLDLPREHPDLQDASRLLASEYMSEYVPKLAESHILEAWAGRRPMIDPGTPPDLIDTMPRIGRVDNLIGMYQSAGWGAFGVTLAFVGGELAAQAIFDDHSAVGGAA